MNSKTILKKVAIGCVVAILLLTGCARTSPDSPVLPKPSVPSVSPDMPQAYVNDNLKTVADYINQTKEVPSKYEQEPGADIKGTVEKVTYDTRAYAYEEYFADELNGEQIHIQKDMYVYLPHDYDPEKQYSTLYLLHGGSEIVEYWFSIYTETDDERDVGDGFLVRLLDHMIAEKTIEPLIVISPGLYVDTHGYFAYSEGGLKRRHLDVKTAEKHDPEKVCSSVQTAWTDNFATEFRNDILPVVESKYSVYKDRLHRGIGGTSMGSITTIRSGLWQCNDLFAWYAPMSAGVTADSAEVSIKKQTDMVWNDVVKDGIDPNIKMLLNFNGTKDMSHNGHVICMNYLLSQSNGKLVNGDNYCFFDIEGFDHNFNAWRYDIWLILQVFFK